MRKLFLLTAVLVMFSAVQAENGGFGLKAGLNLASLNGDDIEGDVNSRVGLYAGAFYEYFLSEQFSIQPELLYSMQGATGEESGNIEGMSYSAESTLKLDYINVPVMAKYYPMPQLFLQAGPQFGFNISAKSKYEVTINGEMESDEGDLEDMKSLELGLGFGAGYKFLNNAGVEARYVIGLSIVAEDADVKNSVFQVGLFYGF